MCGCVCVEKFCAQRSLHVAIQCVKSNLEMSIFWTYNERKWGTTIADGRKDKW